MRYTIREWIYSESIILDSNYSALKVPSVLQRDGWVRNLWCFEGFRFLVSGKEDRRQADKHRALLVHSVQRGSWLLRILFNQIWHGGFNLGEGGCWGLLGHVGLMSCKKCSWSRGLWLSKRNRRVWLQNTHGDIIHQARPWPAFFSPSRMSSRHWET